MPENERTCKRCGNELVSMGREKIRTEVQFIPATVKIIDFYRESFQCLECRKQEHFSIEKPAMPQPVLAKSIASPSSVAHVITQKYQFAMPLYRQEKEWKQEEADASISGQTIKRINELFALDKTLADKTPEERQQERLRLEKDKLEAFFAMYKNTELC